MENEMMKCNQKRAVRTITVLIMVIVMVFTLAACGSKTPAPAAPAGGAGARDTLNVGVFLDTGTLDPVFMTGHGLYLSALRTYCEPLWEYDFDTGERQWVLATAFEPITDTHYTLKIREGVTFSNGNPLTAEDVLFSFTINAADARAYINVKAIDIEKTNVVDDYTLDVWYTAYNPSQEPGIPMMLIVDAESYDQATYSDNPVGTGPYVVEDYVVNNRLTVERRDDYWGEKPTIKTINFKCLGELSQRVNGIETGDIDFAMVSAGDIDYLESLGTVGTKVLYGGSSLAAVYNMGDSNPLGSVEARQAVSYAINRQAIVDVAYSGHADIVDWGASNHLIEMQDRYLNMTDWYTDSYNIEKAKQLAEQSGLVGKTIRIVTNGEANYITAAEVIQNGLEEIGVDAKIVNYDQAAYFSFLMSSDNEYDIAINTPAGPGNQPCDVFGNYPVFVPQDWSGPDREKYLALSEKANSTYDLEEREDLVYEMLLQFNEHLLWYGLCEDPNIYAFNNELKNIKYTTIGNILYQYITF
jgi:peptide/nickel transport system substrate-binding protein